MPETKKHPINHEWDEHYEMLEFIRRTGITNMWGAAPYLAEGANISRDLATKVHFKTRSGAHKTASGEFFFLYSNLYYLGQNVRNWTNLASQN